ncbi:diiron oxygenase [Paraburkholderia sp. ZP32-5]|uniref:diiron oxygenase n=1 Tax=Paraburkholderia sp. ZP32-5 TaxID=2883245 RepID=UPI001F445EBB|nr:diiron oxygenase [Paraburkholderia sp. ZP32-5]
MLQAEMTRKDVTDSWYEKATVRHTPRIFASDCSGDGLVHPLSRCVICDHPLVLARGSQVRSYIITQDAYLFLYNVGLMETKFVIHASLDVLHGKVAGISDASRLQALTVIIDEGYHAHVALDYVLQLQQHSGIEPLRIPQTNRKLDAVERTTAALPDELRRDFNLLAVTIAENVLTDEVASMGREKNLNHSFITLMKDHVRDEGRHSSYFSDLMTARWSELPDTTRAHFGTMLPDYLDDYLAVDPEREFERRILRACDFSAEHTEQIIADSEAAFFDNHVSSVKETQSRLLRLLKKIGVLDLEANRRAFATHGYAV